MTLFMPTRRLPTRGLDISRTSHANNINKWPKTNTKHTKLSLVASASCLVRDLSSLQVV